MTTPDLSEAKTAARAAWRLGDYHRFATELVWEVGPVLVAACAIGPGQRALDVAAGTGNVAIRAAEAGGSVVASDLTPEHFEAGRAEARSRGVELDWVEADAEALPFADDSFDVVTSSFGAMFAPDHRAVADELVRVCRPGGTIGLASFTPDGLAAEFFGVFAPYLPPPRLRLPDNGEAHRREPRGSAGRPRHPRLRPRSLARVLRASARPVRRGDPGGPPARPQRRHRDLPAGGHGLRGTRRLAARELRDRPPRGGRRRASRARRRARAVRRRAARTDERGIAELDGVRIAWVRDPDRQVLSIFQPL